MEREEHIEKLSKLVSALGELSLQEGGGFWWAYGLYQSAKALKSGAVSKDEITKYDEKIELYVEENKSRYKIVV